MAWLVILVLITCLGCNKYLPFGYSDWISSQLSLIWYSTHTYHDMTWKKNPRLKTLYESDQWLQRYQSADLENIHKISIGFVFFPALKKKTVEPKCLALEKKVEPKWLHAPRNFLGKRSLFWKVGHFFLNNHVWEKNGASDHLTKLVSFASTWKGASLWTWNWIHRGTEIMWSHFGSTYFFWSERWKVGVYTESVFPAGLNFWASSATFVQNQWASLS